VSAAEANGWHAQSTSVPGVAQRTGATLYYIEMLPARAGTAPVFALMPAPGDVDVVIAAELMEGGRAILRGLVTPDRTLLIVSTHRNLAIAEKQVPGEAVGDAEAVAAAMTVAAKRVIAFNMEKIAQAAASVISAPLLGALAASGALPFPRESFETAISAGEKGAASSLKAFAEACAIARRGGIADLPKSPPKVFAAIPDDAGHPKLNALLARIREFPETLQPMVFAGTRRLTDYQDTEYAGEYLDRLGDLLARDDAGKGYAFMEAAAKYLASAMAYDDVIGVADAKIRARRFSRIYKEMQATSDQPVYVTEFFHPRAQELIGLMPMRWGRWVAARPRLVAILDRMVNRGRRIETAKLAGFLQLYALSALRPWRRKLLRHAEETEHIEYWLALAASHVNANYALAVGILNARRLIKGYADTHARGQSKFDRVLSAVPLLAARPDAGDWMARLVAAALKDEEGEALDGVIATIRTL
jgi:indolepyruvate ferredoxin oxidoreductase beta subunit